MTKLSFTNAEVGTIDVALHDHKRAVIYMDSGAYQVVKHFAGNQQSLPVSIQIVSDTDITL